MVYDAAIKADAGKDVRTEASMVKLYGTEMATEIVDRRTHVCDRRQGQYVSSLKLPDQCLNLGSHRICLP